MGEIRLSPEEYRLLVEQAPILIWRAGTMGACDYFNERWLAFTGRTLDQEVGDGWTEGVHGEDLDGCLQTYQGAFARREVFEMQYRLRRHDGQYRWINDRGVPCYDGVGSFVGYIGSCVDITDKVEAEARLREAEAHEMRRLRGLLPICAECKSIRDDEGYWHSVESYIREHSEADFSHGVCPDCIRALYPDMAECLLRP